MDFISYISVFIWIWHILTETYQSFHLWLFNWSHSSHINQLLWIWPVPDLHCPLSLPFLSHLHTGFITICSGWEEHIISHFTCLFTVHYLDISVITCSLGISVLTGFLTVLPVSVHASSYCVYCTLIPCGPFWPSMFILPYIDTFPYRVCGRLCNHSFLFVG